MPSRNQRPQVILAFGYGKPADLPANRQIAQSTEAAALDLKIPVVFQDDLPISERVRRLAAWEIKGEPSKHLSTAEVIFRFAKRTPPGTVVLVEAAQPHMRRCCRDLARLGYKPIPDRRIAEYPRTSWFSKRSSQPWTRTRIRGYLTEQMLLSLPWPLYLWFAKHTAKVRV